MLNAKKCLYNWLFFSCLLSSYTLYAQSEAVAIKGKIGDSVTLALLPDASLSLLRLPDSVVIRRSTGGKNGFQFARLKPGQYLLSASNIGYRDTAILISLKSTDTVFNSGTIWLQPAVRTLVEVVVKAIIPPVIMKSDTLVYDPAAFKTRPNANLEELLKKLPGIRVDRDGNITLHGEKVQKVFVDGKEFFLNDPKLATQNLLADMVDKVEAFNEKSERAKLTGIPDANPGKVINLRLKPDKKKGLFGSAEGAVATQNRYGLKGTANYFKGDMYLSGMASGSNGGNLQGGGGTLNNKVTDKSLNYRNTFGKKWDLTASYRGTGNNTWNRINNQRQTFLQDSSLLQHREMQRAGNQQNHAINANLIYALDSFSRISSSMTFNVQEKGNSNKDRAASKIINTNELRAVNDALTDNNRTDHNRNGLVSLNYDHRFRKQGRYIGVGVYKGNSRSSSNGALASLTRYYNEAGVMADSLSRDQRSFQTGDSWSYGLNVTYTEPLATGQVLDFSYSLGSSSGNSKQETFNYSAVSNKYDELDSIASNSFKSSNNSQQVAVGYNFFRKKLQWQAGIAVARNTQLNKDLSGHLMDINQSVTNIFPRASLIYSIDKQKNLQVNYNGSNRPPTIQELQPLPDYSNPLLIRVGNPVLKQEFTNEIRVSYRDYKGQKNRLLYTQVEFKNTTNKIANATRINGQGAQEQQAVNLQGNYALGTNIDYNRSFGKGANRANFGINTSLRYDKAVNLVNAEKNIRKTVNWVQGVRMECFLKEKFNVGVSAGFNGSWSTYSVDAGEVARLFSHYYGASLYYELPWQCSISSDLYCTFNAATRYLSGTRVFVWNAALTKRLLKSQSGEVKLSAFDLLNNSNNFSQITGDNYIETTQLEVLKRVFVLSFKYNFRLNKL